MVLIQVERCNWSVGRYFVVGNTFLLNDAPESTVHRQFGVIDNVILLNLKS